jgi:transposase
MIASIDCLPDGTDADVMFYMQPESIDGQSIINYLDALHREIPGNIVLIWDRLSAHRSKIVKEHIKACSDWLEVHPFPAYAPELNPVEYMFSSLRAKDVANLCPVTIDHIARRLEGAVDRLVDDNIIPGFLRASSLF